MNRLLPCPCGAAVPVAAVQSGSVVACACGTPLKVPQLSAYLDLPAAEQPPVRPALSPADEYHDWLRHLTRRVWVTPLLIALNLLVFAGMVAEGVSATHTTGEDAVLWGANSGPDVAAGQVWRLVSAAFVHYGLLHLTANMLCLVLAGPLVERLFGPVAFLGVYLAAAVFGGVVSLFWNPLGGGAGASLALYGMLGAGLTLLLRLHDSAPRLAGRTIRRLGWFVGLGVFGDIVGLLTPPRPDWQIDHVGHLAGLLAGVLLAAVTRLPDADGRPPLSRRRLAVGLAAVVVVAGSGGGWARHANAWVRVVEESCRLTETANRAYGAAYERWKADGGGDLRPLADAIDREVLPAVRAAQIALTDPGRVPADGISHLDLHRRYAGLLAAGYTKMADACRSGGDADMAAANAALEAADQLFNQPAAGERR